MFPGLPSVGECKEIIVYAARGGLHIQAGMKAPAMEGGVFHALGGVLQKLQSEKSAWRLIFQIPSTRLRGNIGSHAFNSAFPLSPRTPRHQGGKEGVFSINKVNP